MNYNNLRLNFKDFVLNIFDNKIDKLKLIMKLCKVRISRICCILVVLKYFIFLIN